MFARLQAEGLPIAWEACETLGGGTMTTDPINNSKELEDAALEAVKLQAAYRSRPSEQELIAAVMAHHPELTEEEARRELELYGGL
jgi:hypothetical protein